METLPTPNPSVKRLESLDILRGLDLFLLVGLHPVWMSLFRTIDTPFARTMMSQFMHGDWRSFTVWDMVMPLFLFMAGAALPFSMSKCRFPQDRGKLYKKILKRVVLLFLLGMIVQGNLLRMDHHYFRFYSNTLQAIAAGYLITSIILMHLPRKGQYIACAALLVIYWIPVTFCGDFTPEGNFAMKLEKMILGRFMDAVWWDDQGVWHYGSWYYYTWIWSSLTFGVTVLLGAFAGQIMKEGKDPVRNVRTLFIWGVALIAGGLLWSIQMPIIKKIWTSSMALYSGGICFLLMGLFYYIVDCKGRGRGLGWLKIYGMNSIAAYMIGTVVSFRSIPQSLFYGLEPYLKEYYPVWITLCNYLIIFFILRLMYRRKIFLKI